jgi:hypothetical protein
MRSFIAFCTDSTTETEDYEAELDELFLEEEPKLLREFLSISFGLTIVF